MTKKLTAEERLEALEQELARQRDRNDQLQQQLQNTVARFPEGTTIEPAVQVIDDRTEVVGLRNELVPFWPVKSEIYPKHPHNEAYAIARGYRAATPADFKEFDGVSPEERFQLVTSRMHGHALYVISRDLWRQRKYQEERRNAQVANRPMPEMRDHEGNSVRVGPGVTETGPNAR